MSFFSWFGLCLLLQAASHYHYYTFKGNNPRESTIRRFSQETVERRGSLFVESLAASQDSKGTAEPALETVLEDEENKPSRAEGTLDEPLVSRREQYRRDGMNRSYFYQTGYFDPNNLRTADELEETKGRGNAVSSSCTQNYENIVAEECDHPIKWYTRLWLACPFKIVFDIFVLGFKRTFSCCKKESGKCCAANKATQKNCSSQFKTTQM